MTYGEFRGALGNETPQGWQQTPWAALRLRSWFGFPPRRSRAPISLHPFVSSG